MRDSDRRLALQERLKRLSPDKYRLFQRRLNGVSYDPAARSEIPRRSSAAPALLSFAQQRLWLLNQLHPDSAFYNLPVVHLIEGPLDTDALGRSLNEIVRRHEALRTTFMAVGDQPLQVIAPATALPLPLIDLQDLPEAEHTAAVERLRGEEAERPFDLAQGPLLRICLIRLRADRHILLRTFHHIVADGWSMGVFIHELATLYAAFAAGAPSPLAELPIQYADYAHWQRQRLTPAALAESLAYWKTQLAGAAALLQLPLDRPRPALQSFRGSARHFLIDPACTARLKDLGQRLDATLFMVLYAAFVTLLYRYSGQNDMIVGIVTANRDRRELEPLIGFFVNTLPLRVDLSGDPSFAELVRRVRATALAAHPHRELPFEQLVDALRLPRNLGHTPLVQVVVGFQNVPAGAVELPGLRITHLPTTRQTTVFDLTLSIAEVDDALAGTFEYSTDLFDAQTIDHMIEHYQVLLDGVGGEAERRLLDIPFARHGRAAADYPGAPGLDAARGEAFNF